MNIKEIKEMINLMNENNLMELEIEKEGMRIKLRKTGIDTAGGANPIITGKQTTQGMQADFLPEEHPAATKTIEIKAPMVGTFYRAANPESPPYLETSQTVEVGQVICIIEAMKLMNEIKSEIRGKVTEILVDNAEPVEFGQPLFLVEPL
ncbi:MAG: acetyl-CoA carboxylase biotin carboxyl carrier protein [Candidatus Omnitrophota bacterium]